MRCLLLLLLFSSALPVLAQEEVLPDTLDWRGYYPLAVGNAWEWKTEIFFGYLSLSRREITGDTIVDQRRYFVQTEYEAVNNRGDRWTRRDTLLVRYDLDSARVVALHRSSGQEQDLTCDLDAPFGGRAACENGEEFYVGGGYFDPSSHLYLTVGDDTLQAQAQKSLYGLGGGTTYYYGIGWLEGVGDGNTGSTDFVYIRIGQREYGRSQVVTDVEAGSFPERQPIFVYPNPVRGRLRIGGAARGAIVAVYDLRGRVVLRTTCDSGTCELDGTSLAAGTYFARVEEGSSVSSHAFVVLK